MGGTRYSVWGCSVGDYKTNKTVINKVVDSDNILDWVTNELGKLDSWVKTVVVRINDMGITDCTAVHVFERKTCKFIRINDVWVEYDDEAVKLMIRDYFIHISADGGVGVVLPLTIDNVSVLRALIETGSKLSLVAPGFSHAIEVKETNNFVRSLNF